MKVRIDSEDVNPVDVRAVTVRHDHGFRVDRVETPEAVKETIVLEGPPTFTGDFLELTGKVLSGNDLSYADLHIFDASGAIDHFAEFEVDRDKNWTIKIRRSWLEGRTYPISVDPTLSVAGNDIHLFRRVSSNGCFHPDTMVVMQDETAKPIADIVIGDLVKGGLVHGVMKFGSRELFDYRGIFVSPDHIVKHGDTWELVGNALRDPKRTLMVPVIHLIQTDSGRMWVENSDGEKIQFSAYEGTPMDDYIEEIYQSLVMKRLQTDDDG